ncbi:hypothetical protein GCM10022280_22200 [Sphingomonas swuensis]|uniref:Uncharacterized protein n=1 Tax=Sphingomonas swuensis TaxID=977800 RepID=A0ABP7T541_9SPHN
MNDRSPRSIGGAILVVLFLTGCRASEPQQPLSQRAAREPGTFEPITIVNERDPDPTDSRWLPHLREKDCERFDPTVVDLTEAIGQLRDKDVGAVGYMGPSRLDAALVEGFNELVDYRLGVTAQTRPTPASDTDPADGVAISSVYVEMPMRPLTNAERRTYCRVIMRSRRTREAFKAYERSVAS